jgi:hypothetical protein
MMRHIPIRQYLVILGLTLVGALSSVHATPIPVVSTLPASVINAIPIGGVNDYAAGFVWNSTSPFASADLYLSREGTPSAGLNISLFSSAGGSPGSLLP